MEHFTHWEDEHGAEYDIKISYTISEEEPMQPNPDHPMFGPGCPAEVDIDAIYRYEPYSKGGVETGMHWELWEGESDAELEVWKTEIMESDERDES